MQDQPRHKFRRAMIVLGDGDDNASRYTRDQALEMAQKADVVVYCISTNNTVFKEGDKVLAVFRQRDRWDRFLFKLQDLRNRFRAEHRPTAAAGISSNVLYCPDPLIAYGEYYKVDIRCGATAGDFVVRARKGYYAPEKGVAFSRAFCSAHGGENDYVELYELYST